MTRREALQLALIATAAGTLTARGASAAGTLNFADIGVGDPGGDWSKFTAAKRLERQPGFDRQRAIGGTQRAGGQRRPGHL